MPTIATLAAEIIADTTGLVAGCREAEGTLQQTASRMEGLGKTLSVGLTTPIVGLGLAAIQAATHFATAMRQVQASTRPAAWR